MGNEVGNEWDHLLPTRDALNTIDATLGDLYMRLNGWYWLGPKNAAEPKLGYRKFTGPAQLDIDAAKALVKLALNT